MKTEIRVFMVDDNKDVVNEVKKYFSSRDFGVKIVNSCFNGDDALKELKKNYASYDLVLMDLVIPKRDGLSVLEELKKNNINIKSIITTCINSVDIIKKCMDVGVSYYMLKPYNLDSLADIIKKIVNNKNNTKIDNKDLQQAITNLLHSLGMPSHIKGYTYIRDGINLMYNKPSMLGAITKELYPEIASMYDTTSSRVERAIRHAIEVSWNRGDWDLMDEIFGHSVDVDKAKPTNSEFIVTVADKLRLEYQKECV